MSTILNAFDKRQRERDSGSQPDSILERNAFHRDLVRRASSHPSRLWMLAIGLGTVGLVAMLAVAAFLVNRKPGRGTADAISQTAGLPKPQVVVEVVTTPQPEQKRPQATPLVRAGRETVRLRTTPFTPPPAPVKLTPLAAVVPTPSSTPDPARTPGPQDSPTVQQSKDPSELLRVTGIILNPKDPQRSSALINDRIVRVGDVVEGAKVVSIDNPYNVQVQYQGKQYTLELR